MARTILMNAANAVHTIQCAYCDCVFEFEDEDTYDRGSFYIKEAFTAVKCPKCEHQCDVKDKASTRFVQQHSILCPHCQHWVIFEDKDISVSPKAGRRSVTCEYYECRKKIPESKWKFAE